MPSRDPDLRKQLNLSYVPRWTIVPMLRQQTVSDHSWRVAMIAGTLATRLGMTSGMHMCDAVMHDLDEVYTGDVPATEKEQVAVNQISNSQILLKVADLIEAMTWVELWGHPSIRQVIINRIRKRFVDTIEEFEKRYKGAMSVALQVHREVLDGRD